MDLDKSFVAALVRGGLSTFRSARDRGIETGWLAGEGAKAYTFVAEYCSQYGTTPSFDLITGKTGVALPEDVPDSPEFLIEEVVSRQVHYLLREGMSSAVEDVQSLPPAKALENLEQLVRSVRKVSDSLDTSVMPLTQLYGQVLDFYDRVKFGERGVLSPWPQMNEDTYGFWPEDLVLFTARSGVGKCVAASTLLQDPVTGLLHTIERVFGDSEVGSVVSWSRERGVHGRPIAAKIDTGTKECLRFVFGSGREIIVTPEHPFLTPTGWARADSLPVGATVGAAASVPFPSSPEMLPMGEIELLAIMLADGCCVARDLRFTKEDSAIVSVAREAARSIGCAVKKQGRNWSIIRASSDKPNPLKECLKSHGVLGKLSKDKEVPSAIFRLPRNGLARFLSVFFSCDGYVGNGVPGVTLASRRFVYQLQHLLLRFGIQSTVHYKPARCQTGVFDSWRLRVCSCSADTFDKEIGLLGAKGEKFRVGLSKEGRGNFNVGFPVVSSDTRGRLQDFVAGFMTASLRRSVADRLGRMRAFGARDLFHPRTGGFSVSRRVFDVLGEAGIPLSAGLFPQGVFWDEVCEIAAAGPTKIYDLTVRPTSCFVANDLIVHNSWTIVLQAHCCWKAGKRALVCSPEMSRLRLAMRMAAVDLNLPYDDFRKGRLGEFQERAFRKRVEDLQKEEDSSAPFVIGGDTFDFRLDTYAAALRETKVDLGILDGAYLMMSEGGDRVERAQNTFNMLKRVCKQTKIPTLVTTQLNRNAKTNSPDTVDLTTVAQTDASGWNADVVYALIQTDDMRRDRIMQFKPLKVREGVGRTFEARWDHEEMNFSEIERQGGDVGGGGGDPFAARRQVKNPDAEVDF